MAIYIKFKPEEKNFDIHSAIREKIAGNEIRTWGCTNNQFSNRPKEWERSVWMRSTGKGEDWIKYDIFPGDIDINPLTKTEYTITCGRFVEMLLTHFNEYIENIKVESFKQ